MQTSLDPKWETLIDLTEVDTILRSCVHCGFCTSGCPTYQLLGDENDSPRGRIYLMKQVFEGDSSFETVAPHLDRCLTCRSCETNCPSGVEYGRLLDISRGIMHQTRSRFNWSRLKTTLLIRLLRQNWLMDWLFSIGRLLRRLPALRHTAQLPFARNHQSLIGRAAPQLFKQRSSAKNLGKVIVLKGCLQRHATPRVVEALCSILNWHGYEPVLLDDEPCCGALPYHLGDHVKGAADLAALSELIRAHSGDVVAVLSSATGCATFLAGLAEEQPGSPSLETGEPRSEKTFPPLLDPVTFLKDLPAPPVRSASVAIHEPCTQTHGMKLRGEVQRYLTQLGFNVVSTVSGQGCCGSAGTYSLLQPVIARRLRSTMLDRLESDRPDVILTANVGCQVHMDSAGRTPVMHWLEWVAQSMEGECLGDAPDARL